MHCTRRVPQLVGAPKERAFDRFTDYALQHHLRSTAAPFPGEPLQHPAAQPISGEGRRQKYKVAATNALELNELSQILGLVKLDPDDIFGEQKTELVPKTASWHVPHERGSVP